MKTFISLCLLTICINCHALHAQGWVQVGPGISNNGFIDAIAKDAAGNIYAAGNFINDSSYEYVAVYDGTGNWHELGTGTNALHANNTVISLITDDSGYVYAAGAFTDSLGYCYIAKWNGKNWSELGTGINALKANNSIFSIAKDAFGNIYAAGGFTNNIGCYVAKWDGTTWSALGTGNNAFPNNTANWINCIATDIIGNVYAGGYFTTGGINGFPVEGVVKWNGTTWSTVGAGANGLNADNPISSIAIDAAGNIYAAGDFTDVLNYYYVAKWDGNSWSELGTGTNRLKPTGVIETITIDSKGNVYAAGDFSDSNNKTYVAVWNGTTWSALGTGANALNGDCRIDMVIADKSDNIYVTTCAGINSTVDEYAYTNSTDKINIQNQTTYIYPNPNNGQFTIGNMPSGMLIQVYDMLGTLVKEENISANNNAKINIDISDKPAGVYLVKVSDGKQQSTYKVIVSH